MTVGKTALRTYRIACKVYDNKKINKRDVEFINSIMNDVEDLLHDFNKDQYYASADIETIADIGSDIITVADNCEYSKSCEDKDIYISSVDMGLRGELHKYHWGE